MNNKQNDIAVSFEFFPPRTPEMETILWEAVDRLSPLQPSFMSVTYGAGGTTRERTHATLARLLKETDVKPAAHLTCVGASKDEVNAVIRDYHDIGVRHIVALRGDPPGGPNAVFEAAADGYQSSADLVRGIREIGEFEVSVSAYPEKHPQSASFEQDLDVLKAKIDAGATRAISNFFFDNDVYFRFLDKVRAAGIKIPIIPGLMPVQNFRQQANFAHKTGVSVPVAFAARFEGLDDDAQTRRLIAAAIASEQALELRKNGIDQFHFYTMNRADLVYAVCHLLGVRPQHSVASAV